MNLPTLIVLILVAAAIFLALWLPRKKGRRMTGCSCCDRKCAGCPKAGTYHE
ncbi:MAG: FeoB-associated Cys-rich membrane protein [Bacteroidales bacterium]|nr:FeoB-associated Cys-rich membrane protein [Bacteroidales bacterium]